MQLNQHPELLDKLAASYALGTLRGGARRRFEALAREQAPVRAAALIWQARLGSVAELQAQAAPAPAVWTRIDNLVRADQEQQTMQNARQPAVAGPVAWLRSLALWRSATAVGAAVAVFAVVLGVNQRDQLGSQIASLRTQLQATPQIEYVAVLADGKADPSMLVTFDAKNQTLLLQRVGGYQEASDKSLQLWALLPSGGPRSLGVLGSDKLLRLTAGESDVREVPALAISLEPKGGVPSAGGPTGPVLFKGALIQKVL
ncbi:anti-sigma-K factor RskA [Rhodoferax ferrireducens]|uniref:Anti-sigma-K factor RskA n=1 Tax=Rhodoferax ferrireducens TaxID=192843 RepID=A0ABU2C9R3_9BURK|nr:anti-sigma factor [Rhodoferax ferrireducens]MDR7378082.1 anti-sigma-K factor RskA [Rhodoferax ferrireducens]